VTGGNAAGSTGPRTPPAPHPIAAWFALDVAVIAPGIDAASRRFVGGYREMNRSRRAPMTVRRDVPTRLIQVASQLPTSSSAG